MRFYKQKHWVNLLLFLSVPGALAQTQALRDACKAHRPQDKDFLQSFPYSDYMCSVPMEDIMALQTDRTYLNNFGIGDAFLYSLCEAYQAQDPVDNAKLEVHLALGELYLGSLGGMKEAEAQPYRIMGYYVLGKVATYLSEAVASGRRPSGDAETRALLARLELRSVYVSLGHSQWQKFWINLGQGNFDYVARRMRLKVDTHFLPYQRMVGLGNAWPLYLGVLVLCAGLFVAFRRKRLVFLVCASFIGGPLILGFAGLNFSSGAAYHCVADRSYHHDEMKLEQLLDSKNKRQGQLIWLNMSSSSAHYFARGDIFEQLRILEREGEVMLATAGGFTNYLKQPEGLTIDAGHVVNAVIQPGRDGLVLMTGEFGVHVLNLKDADLVLPDGQVIENPLRSLKAYAELVHWCGLHQATMFQTQLVIYRDRLLIDPDKAVKRFRERRLLAITTDIQTGDQYHVIINITEPHMLATLSAELQALMEERGQRVEALLNLDVGLYDILTVFDDQGQPLPDLRGKSDSRDANSLIVYARLRTP